MRAVAIAAVVVASVFAGCASDTAAEVEETTTPPPPFRLHVEVRGLDGAPLSGATVTVAGHSAGLPELRNATDAGGVATFDVPRGVTLAIALAKEGHVEERSTPVGVHVPGALLGDLLRGIAIGLTLGLACIADASLCEFPVNLVGDSATLRFVLLPEEVAGAVDVPVGQVAANPAFQERWSFDATPRLASDDARHAFAMSRVADAALTLRWTNAPPSVADLDLAYGCDADQLEEGEQGPLDMVPGERAISVAWTAPAEGCAFSVWVSVDSASSGVTAQVEHLLRLRGAEQRPEVV